MQAVLAWLKHAQLMEDACLRVSIAGKVNLEDGVRGLGVHPCKCWKLIGAGAAVRRVIAGAQLRDLVYTGPHCDCEC